jgi:opacity protein-like surface antigen
MKLKLFGAVAAIALMTGGTANALVFDTFGTTTNLTDTTIGGDVTDTIVDGANILGGERETFLSLQSGSQADVDINSPNPGVLSLNNDTGSRSNLTLRYDGVGAAGLGGVDATEGGAHNAFDLFIQFDDSPIDIRLTAFSATGSSDLLLSAPGNIFNVPGFEA